jgi:phage-related protein
MPHSRPMSGIGKGCHELRVNDVNRIWRIVYRVDSDAIVIGEIFAKTTEATPQSVIQTCKKRFKEYDDASRKA